MIDKYRALIAQVLESQALPSEDEMIQEIIKEFQVPRALLGLHEGMIVDSNLVQEKTYETQEHSRED